MDIGWGIVGIGHFAELAMVPAMRKAINTKIVGVCSRSIDKAKDFAGRHNIPGAYDSYEDMINSPEIEAIYIATPNHLHASQTIMAAKAGKHVLCEKPMAMNIDECEKIIEACDKNNVKFGVNFHNRFVPANIEARKYIKSGTMGEITFAEAMFCRGTSRGFWKGWKTDPKIAGSGALNGQGLHPIDILRFILDSEIKEVRALTDEEPPNRTVDDMVYAILRFENGIDGVVVSGLLAPRSDNYVALYGSKAKLYLKDIFLAFNTLGELTVDSDDVNIKMEYPKEEAVQVRNTYVIEAFNKSIAEDVEFASSGQNGLQMVKIADAVLESSRQGKAVKIK